MNKNEILLFDESKSETNIVRNKYMKEIIYSLYIFLQSFKESKFDKNLTNNIIDEVSNIIQILKSYGFIYIPFLGLHNSGKSTLINGIIGKDILPTGLERGTKSVIIIRYNNSDETIIRKAYLKKKNYFEKDFYYFELDEIIGKGIDQIKEILNSLNNDNIDDCFYCISTKIKLFDDLGLDDYQKNMIHLIDFPGYEPNNIFEK
jgi:ribosome biogenesis GTPase A